MFHLVTFCQCPLRAICCFLILISLKCNIKYKYCTSLLCSRCFHQTMHFCCCIINQSEQSKARQLKFGQLWQKHLSSGVVEPQARFVPTHWLTAHLSVRVVGGGGVQWDVWLINDGINLGYSKQTNKHFLGKKLSKSSRLRASQTWVWTCGSFISQVSTNHWGKVQNAPLCSDAIW